MDRATYASTPIAFAIRCVRVRAGTPTGHSGSRNTRGRPASRDAPCDRAHPGAVRSARHRCSSVVRRARTANAVDYTFEAADASHFIIDERPDLVRARLIALAEETAGLIAVRRRNQFCKKPQ